jgi:hypothetical protein
MKGLKMTNDFKIQLNYFRNHLSRGNSKLPKSTAIFNLTPAKKCPSEKLGFCQAEVNGKNICYAKKAEWLYPPVLPYRIRQMNLFNSMTADEFAFFFRVNNARKTKPFSALRFNESGDLKNQTDLDKVEKIAQLIVPVKTYLYTARQDLNFSNVKHAIINTSNFTLENFGEFRMILKNEKIPIGFKLCPGNCRICIRCQQKNKNSAVRQH